MTKKYTLEEIEWVLKKTHLSGYVASTIPIALLNKELKVVKEMSRDGEL
jgi:hypothetical protein